MFATASVTISPLSEHFLISMDARCSLLVVLANYAHSYTGNDAKGKGDLNGSKKVDVEDLLIVLSEFGRKC